VALPVGSQLVDTGDRGEWEPVAYRHADEALSGGKEGTVRAGTCDAVDGVPLGGLINRDAPLDELVQVPIGWGFRRLRNAVVRRSWLFAAAQQPNETISLAGCVAAGARDAAGPGVGFPSKRPRVAAESTPVARGKCNVAAGLAGEPGVQVEFGLAMAERKQASGPIGIAACDVIVTSGTACPTAANDPDLSTSSSARPAPGAADPRESDQVCNLPRGTLPSPLTPPLGGRGIHNRRHEYLDAMDTIVPHAVSFPLPLLSFLLRTAGRN
jgi:hypothetical protein